MILEKIQSDLISAMKSRETEVVSVLRMLVSALKYAQIDNEFLTEIDEIKVLNLEAKKRKESIASFQQVDPKRAKVEENELVIIQKYLPVPMSDQQILDLIASVKLNYPQLSDGPLMGKIMSEAKSMKWILDGDRVKTLLNDN